jgi:hypothetical protein
LLEHNFLSIDKPLKLSLGFEITRIYSDEEKLNFAREIIEQRLLSFNSLHANDPINEIILTNEMTQQIIQCGTLQEVKLYMNSFLNEYFMNKLNGDIR